MNSLCSSRYLTLFALAGYFLSSSAGPALLAVAEAAKAKAAYGKIELLRDTWGIPHVFAETDAGAMYGLGYATAEERGFQMTYNLRLIQGRLSEIVGDRPKGNRNETSVDHDRKMRTFGWARAADRTVPHLDRPTLALLEAYSQGVNDSFAQQAKDSNLHPLFERFGLTPEPWKPADCLLSWWHLAQFFAPDGTRDLMTLRNREQPRSGRPQAPSPGPLWIDDATAVVQPGDVTESWMKAVEAFSHQHGFSVHSIPGSEGPKFSHAWVVGGKRTTTRAAVLVSDPQTPVRNPSLWMEFHISGKTLNARGVGVPGSPGLLIGFNEKVAWGLTALGADQADLFRLETDASRPGQYRWDGQWRRMETRSERIAVKGGDTVELTVRETHLGPIISEFAFRQAGDPEVALKRVPLCITNRETIQGVFAMMRARSGGEFVQAARDWQFPSANCVYGDSDGSIGYIALGALPVRSKLAPDSNGREAISGSGDAADWQGFIPHELLPQVVNPQSGLLLSANHRPIASFYQLPLGISTGSMGDTIRSWRLRERLYAKEKFSPEDVLAVHYDTVNPARRDIVRLGLHMRRVQPEELSEDAQNALKVLEPWLKNGASSDLTSDGATLATRISTFFRILAAPAAQRYGGGESGLARFLKDAATRIQSDSKARLPEDESDFVNLALANAWREHADAESGRTSTARGARTPDRGKSLGWFDTLDGFGSLDRSEDLREPGITCLDGQTIHSQAAQSYTQWVPLHDVDSAQSVCPIGHSDLPNGRYRTSTVTLWAEARLHPAPLSRFAVEKIAAARRVLNQ